MLTKAELVTHFDDLVTNPTLHLDKIHAHLAQRGTRTLFHTRWWITSNSGSSSHPGIFLFDPAKWPTVLIPLLGWENRLASRLAAHGKSERPSFPRPIRTPYRPWLGSPSGASGCRSSPLPVSHRPHLILTSSEVLTADPRRRLETAWGDVIFDVIFKEYAATETRSLNTEYRNQCGV